MSVPPQQIRFCTSRDGTRIAFATCGSGPPLVRAAHWLSHLKFDWDSPLWGPWLSLLARRHTLIRYDGRGSGLSDRDNVELSFERDVEDLEAVIKAANVDRFALFASTAAGAPAIDYAARHPEQVTRLILVGCYSHGRLPRELTPEQIRETELELEAIELGWANDNPAFRQFFTSLFIPDGTAAQARSLNELLRRASLPAIAAKRLRVFHGHDVREVAPKVQCPTLVLHSREDARIPFEKGRALAALIPGARFVPLESRNHWIVDTEPAWKQFVDELENFLPVEAPSLEGAAGALVYGLTPRERDVLELIAQGLDNSTIGRRLGISEKTVRNHASIVFSKLGVHSRAQAIVRARDAGLGTGPRPGRRSA